MIGKLNRSRDRAASPPRMDIRRWVQSGVLVLTLAVGVQFALYVAAAAGSARIGIPRPSSVEGFLPIGALMGWKRFAATGVWDPVHPAAMVIFGFVMVASMVLRNAFCGWLCPVGTLSEWLHRAGNRVFGKGIRLPGWIDIPLRGAKYAILAFFIRVIFSMNEAAIAGFQSSAYYRMADVRMLYFFWHPSALTVSVLAALILLSLVVPHFWCRYLCPYGALTGLAAALGPTRIRRDEKACVGCGKCRSACPGRLPVDAKTSLRTPECTGCMQCVSACPKEGALALKTGGFKGAWSPRAMGFVLVAAWLVAVYGATLSGHWKSVVSDEEFRIRLQSLNPVVYPHPISSPPSPPP